MSDLEFLVLALSSLFVIVDPIAIVPSFLAITPGEGPHRRERTARLACLTAAIVLATFAAVGHPLLRVLGITMPAFQIAGSILLLLVSLDMLYARPTPARESPAEAEAAADKDEVAFSPLAVPMLAGPGACSAVMLLNARAQGSVQHTMLYASVAIVCAASYAVLRLAAHHAVRVKPIAMRVATRLMGLLLAAIAVQFFLDGVRDSGLLAGSAPALAPPTGR